MGLLNIAVLHAGLTQGALLNPDAREMFSSHDSLFLNQVSMVRMMLAMLNREKLWSLLQ
jgi:hypothetical protein